MNNLKPCKDLLLLVSFLLVTALQAATFHEGTQPQVTSAFELEASELIHLDKEALTKRLGRKLTLSERLSLKFVQKKLRKHPTWTSQEAFEQVKTDGLALGGFFCGLLSLFVAGIILGIASVVMGIIALSRIMKAKGEIKGQGFAIAGIIIGMVGIFGAILAIQAL